MQKMSFLVYRMKRGLGGRRDCDSAVSPRRPDAVAAAVFSAPRRRARDNNARRVRYVVKDFIE